MHDSHAVEQIETYLESRQSHASFKACCLFRNFDHASDLVLGSRLIVENCSKFDIQDIRLGESVG